MINELPSIWNMAPLSAVCEINPRTKSELKPEDLVSFVPMAAISEHSGSIVASETRQLDEVRKGFTPFQDGDVLFAKITPCMENGKAAIARGLVNRQGYGSTEFHVLRPSSLVMAEWLFAIIRTAEFRRAAAASFQGAVGQQRVTSEFLQRFRIPLPPLSEQQRIVDILQEAETIRSLRAQAEAKTTELIPALFHEMFGNPVANARKWRKAPLGDLINGTPKNGIYKPADLYGEGTPIIRIGDYASGILRDAKGLQRVRISDDETSQFGVTNGQIVINRVNSIEHLGKSLLLAGLTEPTVYESNMMRLDPKVEEVLPDYLIACLQHNSVISKLRAKAKKAINQASINQNDVVTLEIPVPPLEVQQEFVRRIREVDEILSSESQTLRTGHLLEKSLSAHAFSGQITANWREENEKRLAVEARERDIALGKVNRNVVYISAAFKTTSRATVHGTVLREALSPSQQALLHRIEESFAPERPGTPHWFTAEALSRMSGEVWTGNIKTTQSLLALLVARGLVLAVSREQTDERTDETIFGSAYRLPMQRHEPESAEEGEPFPGDFARQTEMWRLAERLTKMRMLP